MRAQKSNFWMHISSQVLISVFLGDLKDGNGREGASGVLIMPGLSFCMGADRINCIGYDGV